MESPQSFLSQTSDAPDYEARNRIRSLEAEVKELRELSRAMMDTIVLMAKHLGIDRFVNSPLDQYWSAKTPAEERAAYAKMMASGMPNSYANHLPSSDS